MSFNLFLIIIFICCFSFLFFQCFEFIQNYDYIQNFNKKYSKYEFMASPSFAYIDKSYYDPNDNETDVKKKWRCLSSNNQWYGASTLGLLIENGGYKSWSSELDCIYYIFTNTYLNYNHPCKVSQNNEMCKLFTQFNLN